MNSEHLKLLIVDDERSNLDVLCKILKPGGINAIHPNYSLSATKSGKSALEKVKNDRPDLIILDIMMPDISGFDILATLQSSEETRSIPIIVITGLDSIEDETKCFEMGAVDYITKPFHSSIVRARVKTHLRIVEQIRTIERLGLIDVLTDITNRRGFDNRLIIEWGDAIRKKTPIGLLMIDIDKFKDINDTYGHQLGDIVLKMVADVITSSLPHPTHLAARWGGEEFAVLLPNTESKDALIIAENIRKNMRDFFLQNDQELPATTVSIGIAIAFPSVDSELADFIKKADKSLYTAKQRGRNRVCYDD